eukprot:g3255.t1
MLPDLGYEFLPEPRPLRVTFARLVSALRRTGTGGGAGKRPAGSAVEAVPSKVRSVSEPGLKTGPKRGGGTAQQRAFLETVRAVDPETAVRELRADACSARTRQTYAPGVNLYAQAMRELNRLSFPASVEGVEIFAAYLKKSAVYINPEVYFWAVVRENKTRGHPEIPKAPLKDMVTALTRGLPEQEQCEPLGVRQLRLLAAAVKSVGDRDCLLSLTCALFTLSRVDAFLGLTGGHVVFTADSVKVELHKLKGETRETKHAVSFEAVQGHEVLVTQHGPVPLCPVAAFRAYCDRAKGGAQSAIARCTNYQSFSRAFNRLAIAAGIEVECEGRRRAMFTAHSTRVGGVCTLLACGLAESCITVVCNWHSDQVKRYARRVLLDPQLVEPFAFYNPRALKGAYSSRGAADAMKL